MLSKIFAGMFIVISIAGLYNLMVSNLVGFLSFLGFLFLGRIYGSPLFKDHSLDWIIWLMCISAGTCVIVAGAEFLGIWDILVGHPEISW
jgi:hypothetical protein